MTTSMDAWAALSMTTSMDANTLCQNAGTIDDHIDGRLGGTIDDHIDGRQHKKESSHTLRCMCGNFLSLSAAEQVAFIYSCAFAASFAKGC
jgi:hypothetical protein